MRILRKLTLKSLKMNRLRTVMTIIGIVLSIALITVITGMATSAWQSVIQSQVRMQGDYDIRLDGSFDEKDVSEIMANRHVRDVYALQTVGLAKNEMANHVSYAFIRLVYTEEKSLAACATRIAEGRFPKTDSELLIPPQLANSKEKSYHVGDTVTLSIGKRFYKEGVISNEAQEVEPGMSYWDNQEEFRVEQQKTYTIVGILEESGGFMGNFYDSSIDAYTGGSLRSVGTLYIRLTDDAEKNYLDVLSQLTGVQTTDVQDVLNSNVSDTQLQSITMDMTSHNPHIQSFGVNRQLLSVKGYYVSEGQNDLLNLVLIVGFVLLVVMAASVFIIRNSFAISVTEKTKLYGMLSSVGATPRQIRANVFFEAVVLGLFGIPIGILLGVGVTGILLALCNALLKDILSGMQLIFWVPWYTYMLAVGLGVVTILLAAYNSAHAASRISPMEAIRSSKEIKIGKRQKKQNYKTPKLIKKIFGIGGSIAWKNMKRSRRQYRTTVLSIIISVAVYLTAASFVNYNIHELQSQHFYRISEFNMQVSLDNMTYDEADETRKAIPMQELKRQLAQIASMDGVKKSRVICLQYPGYGFKLNEKELSAEWQNDPSLLYDFKAEEGGHEFPFNFCAVDDNTFAELCRMNGKTVEECRNKGFITNRIKVYTYDGEQHNKGKEISVFDQPIGTKLDGTCENFYYQEVEGQFEEDGSPVYQEMKTTDQLSIEIAGLYPSDYVLSFNDYSEGVNRIMVSLDWFEKNIQSKLKEDGQACEITMLIDAKDPTDLTEDLNSMKNEGKLSIISGVTNYAQIINNYRSLILLIQVFVYGFILVIILIGVTNIFNTITTNMKLRQKEFAMLRSIGTTKREFNRMIHLECLLYTMKSLLFGIPIGLLSGFGIYWLMNLGRAPESRAAYLFPWMEILLCVFVVLFLLIIIMRFSIAKVSKQNIIETIRNDNI